jgi:PAS domain S-box-containing protein
VTSRSRKTTAAADDAAFAAFLTLPVAVAVLDRDLRFVAVNDALAAANGIPREAHVGRSAPDLLPNLDASTWTVLRGVIETGLPATHLVVGRTYSSPEDGAWQEQFHPWRDATTGEIRGVIATAIDVTDQLRAQRAADQRQQRLDDLAVFASELVGLGTQDEVAGVLCDHARQMFGAAASAVAVGSRQDGIRVLAVRGYGANDHGALDQLAVGTALADTAATGRRHTFVEGDPDWERSFPSGVRLHRGLGLRAVATTPLLSADEMIGAMSVSYADRRVVTADDTAALATLASIGGQALERARAADERRRHAALRDAFTDVIAHELKTPLATIYGGLETLLTHRATLSEAARNELVTNATDEAQRLVRLVDDLIVLSRLERGVELSTVEPLMLSHISRAVVASKVRSFGIAIDLEIDPNVPPVCGEAQYVEQVLRNLIGNAFKYGKPPFAVRIVDRGAEVCVSVLDEGPGVPQDAERLFGLYYRDAGTAGKASGTGIGLFVCRELVRLMGGRTWAANRPSGGAEFGFSLPAWSEDNG